MKTFSTTSSVVAVKEEYYNDINDRSTKRRWIGLLFSFTNAWQLQRKTKKQGRDEEEGPSPFHGQSRNLELEQTVAQSPASSMTARGTYLQIRALGYRVPLQRHSFGLIATSVLLTCLI
jgi:hypothetical protein